MTATAQISLAFDLIRQYAEREGWVPIGWRVFDVGPWTVTVNGTGTARAGVPPYHALVAHRDVVGFLLLWPFGGAVGGWQGSEDAFIADLEAELARGRPVGAGAIYRRTEAS